MTQYKVTMRDGTLCRTDSETPEEAAANSAWGFLPLDAITEPFSVLVTDPDGKATRWTVKVKVCIDADRDVLSP